MELKKRRQSVRKLLYVCKKGAIYSVLSLFLIVLMRPLYLFLWSPNFHFVAGNVVLLCPAVLAHIVSEDGEHVSRETLEALITACDSAPSPCSTELASLFKEKVCSIECFQQWVLANPNMASFSRWLLVESPGIDLEGEADSLSFYQTLSQWYNGECRYGGWGWRGVVSWDGSYLLPDSSAQIRMQGHSG